MMQIAGFDLTDLTVSNLCVTINSPAGFISLHSNDPDFAMRLAVALITAHGRRSVEGPGRATINRTSAMFPEASHV